VKEGDSARAAVAAGTMIVSERGLRREYETYERNSPGKGGPALENRHGQELKAIKPVFRESA
jgi:hypothetical protein